MPNDNASTDRIIGQLQADSARQGKDIDEMKVDLKEIKDILSQAKGGWKTLMLVAGISGSVGALVGKVFPWILK